MDSVILTSLPTFFPLVSVDVTVGKLRLSQLQRWACEPGLAPRLLTKVCLGASGEAFSFLIKEQLMHKGAVTLHPSLPTALNLAVSFRAPAAIL